MMYIYPLLAVALVTGAAGQPRYNTVIDALRAQHETTLLSLIESAGLTATLQGTGPFTIFAPSNTAISQLGSSTLAHLRQNTTALADFLKYHVVSGLVTRQDLMVNEKQLTSLAGTNIRINFYGYTNRLTAEGSMVTRDIMAGNGVVHTVNDVLIPPKGSIMDILAERKDFTILTAAIQAAGLGSALNDGIYTLMAPNDQAFMRLGNSTVQTLLAHPDTLRTLLLYHVLHGTLYSSGMHSGAFPTLDSADSEHITAHVSTVQHFNYVTVDGSRASDIDISATNGVIHVLGTVLMPASLKTAIANLSNPATSMP